MNFLGTLAMVSALAVTCAQDPPYCTGPVINACKQSVNASACITTQCSNQTSSRDCKFRKTMVNGHNKVRAESYFGKFGANMLEMRWNKELEDNAMRWLQHLCETEAFEHDNSDCRKTPSFNFVGQNIWGSSGSVSNMSEAGQSAIDGWYGEKINVTSIDQLIPLQFSFATGHFTQVIWADSYAIGCAYLTKPDASSGMKTWVLCNYAKAGNFANQNVFEPSDSLGSNCPPGTSNATTTGLCKVENEEELKKAINLGPTTDN